MTATIALGIPRTGGSIAYGADSVRAGSFDVPLTVIDAKTNKVLRQWVGRGGDSLSANPAIGGGVPCNGGAAVFFINGKDGTVTHVVVRCHRKEDGTTYNTLA